MPLICCPLVLFVQVWFGTAAPRARFPTVTGYVEPSASVSEPFVTTSMENDGTVAGLNPSEAGTTILSSTKLAEPVRFWTPPAYTNEVFTILPASGFGNEVLDTDALKNPPLRHAREFALHTDGASTKDSKTPPG